MRKIFGYVGKYKIYAILTPITVALEVLLEILIPYLMANIIDIGVKNSDMPYILKTGGIMVSMALLALFFGAISGKFSAMASAGLAKNLRSQLFKKIQTFSFSNINNFNTASLITRLTTDVANTQHAFMMIIRMLVRSPVMLIGATIVGLSEGVAVLAAMAGVVAYYVVLWGLRERLKNKIKFIIIKQTK